QGLIFVTNNATVEPSSKVFTCTQPGYTVLYYLKTGSPGTPANPQTQSPCFEVVRTVTYDDPAHGGLTSANWTIGQEITNSIHTDYNGNNGYVLFEKGPYDGAVTDSDRAYDRATRRGAIIPVNKEKVGPHQEGNPDPLRIVWYHTNRIGVAWASYPVSYSLKWPDDATVDKIVIASALGSGSLDPAFYSAMRLYNQPSTNLPGFNPNEEHALVLENALYAIRDDLNSANNHSLPYALLKYRDTNTTRWAMRVYKVLPEDPANGVLFSYIAHVAVEVQAPTPLNRFWWSNTVVSGPGWHDFKGKLYAMSAGPEGGDTNLVVKWYYQMQPGFYHPDPTVQIGDPLAWLDQRTNGHVTFPNSNVGAGNKGAPIDINYHLQWDATPELQIGETLIHSKAGGLPEIFRQAEAQLIFDDLHPTTPAGLQSLVRFYDPLTPRTLTSGVVLPAGLQHDAINGKWYFPGLPWMLKIRLTYDPVNQWLSFGGYLDENFGAGSNPLLLPNVLSERERDTIKNLAPGDTGWSALIDNLFNLTRNPNGVNLAHPGQQPPDVALRIGLTTVTNNGAAAVVPESYSGGPKALTAALGGVPPAQPEPGNALVFGGAGSYVTIGHGTNGYSDLSLANGSFTIEFWAQVNDAAREQYILAQPSGSDPLGQLRIGFRDGGKFAFDLGTSSPNDSLYNSGDAYTDTNWHHWACSFDASSFTRTIYRDGVAILNTPRTNIAVGPYTGSGPVELGRFLTASNFHGALDEIRVWTSVRNGADILNNMSKRLIGFESGLEIYYRCDEPSGAVTNLSRNSAGGYLALLHNVSRLSLTPSLSPSVGQWGIPPRYVTLAFNNDAPSVAAGLPITLQVIRIDDGPYLGDIKVLPGDNVFDERLTLRHSSDFGGDPGPLIFEWYYQPIGEDFNPEALPEVDASGSIKPGFEHGWIPYTKFTPVDGHGVNYITTGEGSESGLVTISDNAFICRYKGYAVNLRDANTWSGWVGDPSGTPVAPRAVLAEGWVKRVIRGLNPFDARTRDFHSSPADTYASMLVQAGTRYEGPIAFNPSADAINQVGLIEAYQTVLERAKGLSIDGAPPVDDAAANGALLLAATKISDLYMVLGNEAYADAQDPTIGFGSDSTEYGSLSSSIFAFENQLDSLLEEELVLLRGRDKSAAGVAAAPVYNRLFWNFTLGEGKIAYKQVYNITDVNGDGFIDDKDARVLYPQGHGDAWGHYLTAITQHYKLLRHPYFTWVPRSEFVSVAGVAVKVDFLDERKFAATASAKAKVGLEIVDHTYRLAYVDNPAGQWQGYQDTVVDTTTTDPVGTPRAWGVTEWARRASVGAYFDWVMANSILPSTDPNPAHTGIDKIDRHTVGELADIPPQSDEIQNRLDEADAGLNPLGLAKGVVPFDIDPVQVAAGKTHFEQIQDRALAAMNNALGVWDQVNKATQQLRQNQDSVAQFAANTDDQERDYKNRLIEVFGYPYAGDIGPGLAYASGYDGPDLLHYNYVAVKDLNGQTAPPSATVIGYFTTAAAAGAGVDVNTNLATPDLFSLSYPVAKGDWAFVAPTAWGSRRAPGEVQMALSDVLQAQARLRQSLLNYDNIVQSINDKVGDLESAKELKANTLQLMNNHKSTIVGMDIASGVLHGVQVGLSRAADIVNAAGDTIIEAIPSSEIVGLADGGDLLAPAKAAIKGSVDAVEIGLNIGSDAADIAGNSVDLAKEGVDLQSDIDLESLNQDDTISGVVGELTQLLRTEAPARVEAFALREALQQTYGRYL
ncbi:MAG: LamG domain-containing protein, partial [Verrucomicrobia bacterium]|nr:LamG domain-containing protein [Verrucomicrobiota bacterium]